MRACVRACVRACMRGWVGGCVCEREEEAGECALLYMYTHTHTHETARHDADDQSGADLCCVELGHLKE